MRIARLPHLGIRGRLLVLAVVPLLGITSILGYYTISSRLDDVLAAHLDRGRTIARHLASRSEFELFAGDYNSLGKTTENITRDENIEWAAVFDASGKLVASAGPGPQRKIPQEFREESGQEGEKILFSAPILASRVEVTDFETELAKEAGARSESPMGRALVVISKKAMLAHQRHILWLSLVLIAAGLLVSVMLALAIEKRVSNSILRKNRALEEAREKALAAGRERSEFLARMSHEIRTPLNAVVGFSRLLSSDAHAPATEEHLRTIERAATQLQFVVDGILDFTRLEAGGVMLESRPFDLLDCVEDALAMVSPEAHEKGLELVLLADSEVPQRILGDSARITQILVNLLGNAIKFTSAGHVAVTLRLDPASAGGLRLTVRDTGIGIGADKQEELFRPFVQADNSITRKFGGTGLGLAISKRLVQLMGGEIGVCSEEGRGAEFRIHLPLTPADASAMEDRSQCLPQARVLVCDPHPLVRRALRNRLLTWHIEPFEAGTLEAALAMLAPNPVQPLPFDLLVLDLGPGRLTPEAWRQALTEIREHYEGPLLLLAATDEYHYLQPWSEWQPLIWVDKPVRRNALYRGIRQLLEHREEPHELLSAKATEQPNKTQVDLSAIRVLVAEDNAYNRLLMRTLLEARGIRMVEVENGEAAVAAAAEVCFDIILMDIHMPILDGLKAARRIRALPAPNGQVPIVALTADVFSGIGGPQGGNFDDYLFKPLDTEALDAVLARNCPERRDTALSTGTEMITADLLPRLVKDLHAQCIGLKSTIERKDRQSLLEQIHTLKGVCGYFGMPRERQLALALERKAREEPLEKLLSIVEELESGLPGNG